MTMTKNRYQPTEKNRKKVKALAGLGLPQEQICILIGLRSPKTLRRYFSKELSLGIAESCSNVSTTAFKLASSGTNPAMTIFFLKTLVARHGSDFAKGTRREADLYI